MVTLPPTGTGSIQDFALLIDESGDELKFVFTISILEDGDGNKILIKEHYRYTA